VRPHLPHTSRLTVRPDGTQPGQLVLTFRSYQEPKVRIQARLRRGWFISCSSLQLDGCSDQFANSGWCHTLVA
jgi:hypothetical protein